MRVETIWRGEAKGAEGWARAGGANMPLPVRASHRSGREGKNAPGQAVQGAEGSRSVCARENNIPTIFHMDDQSWTVEAVTKFSPRGGKPLSNVDVQSKSNFGSPQDATNPPPTCKRREGRREQRFTPQLLCRPCADVVRVIFIRRNAERFGLRRLSGRFGSKSILLRDRRKINIHVFTDSSGACSCRFILEDRLT